MGWGLQQTEVLSPVPADGEPGIAGSSSFQRKLELLSLG